MGQDWVCPINDIDSDIRDFVKMLYLAGMKPYMSCSGSYKDHKDRRDAFPVSGCVEMLDSEMTRRLLEALVTDKRFKCAIANEDERLFYDNTLPNGLRFKIEFENTEGNIQEILIKKFEEVKSKINSPYFPSKSRINVDKVCDTLLGVRLGGFDSISFAFNDELVRSDSPDEDNFSIQISDKKDYIEYERRIPGKLGTLVQNQYSTKFLSSDFMSSLVSLTKIVKDYNGIRYLGKNQKRPNIVDHSRYNKFLEAHARKAKQLREDEDAAPNYTDTTTYFDPLDFLT